MGIYTTATGWTTKDRAKAPAPMLAETPPHVVGTYLGSWLSDYRNGMGVMTQDGSVYTG